jgi:RNA polymerase sigma-70 factor (ECF subfamily)
MSTATTAGQARSEMTDEQVVERVLQGETALFEIIMRRYNQRLYRVARGILHDDAEAEDVMQDAYVRAYQHLRQFAGKAKFSTWLTRIAVHEALARVERRSRMSALEDMTESAGESMTFASREASPEQQTAAAEVKVLLESAILALPEGYRAVLMMRDIEELSTAETAESLDLTEENVKVRLHRARALLRKELYARAGESRVTVFPFMGERCDRVVKVVLERIAQSEQLV